MCINCGVCDNELTWDWEAGIDYAEQERLSKDGGQSNG